MFVNHSLKQVTAKIVYYGPGLSGKTTNLQYIFSVTNPKTRGELVSIETEIERTLFFDLLPLNVGLVKGYQTKFQLYTVPGQIFYDSTRKLVLKGADGIVFVVDSQELREQAGLESFENLRSNLAEYDIDINEIPLVYQFNKRDLDNASSVERLKKVFKIAAAPFYEAVATDGSGVIETLKAISSLTLKKVVKLLDQVNEDMAGSAPGQPINFDTDRAKEIKKFEELPVRKVAMENIDTLSTRIAPGEEKNINVNVNANPASEQAAPATQRKEHDAFMEDRKIDLPEEDVMTLDKETMVKFGDEPATRVFSKDEFDELMGNQEGDGGTEELPFKNVPDEAAESEDDIFTLGADNMAKPAEKPAPAPAAAPGIPSFTEDEAAAALDIPSFSDSDAAAALDIPSLSPQAPAAKAAADTGSKEVNEFATIVKEEEDFPFQDIPEAEPVKRHAPPSPSAAESAEPPDADEIPLPELDVGSAKVSDILKNFEDQSRIAVIRKLNLKDPHLHVDIKDKSGRVLEQVELYVNPQIKKITIILDVNK